MTFTNPLVVSQDCGDPWMIFHEGFYYFTATLTPEYGLWVWKSPTLTGLEQAEKHLVWKAPESGSQSAQIWAPELHFLDNKWYLYYTASDGEDQNHRHYVLESDNPLGPFVDRGRVHPQWEQYAIDGSVLSMPDGRLFWMYAADGLYIAPMESPLRVDGEAVLFARGTQTWERGWYAQEGVWVQHESHYWIEAPQALVRDGRVFVIYSAGHSATEHYALGMLTLTGDDPMNVAAWTKHPEPVFQSYRGTEGAVYTTGHNSFTQSPDGTEDWLVYHAKNEIDGTFDGRTVRAQRFGWTPDGTPFFGQPIPAGVALPIPSGQKAD